MKKEKALHFLSYSTNGVNTLKSNKTTKPKILIVEDDRNSQELFKFLLGKKYDLSICDEEMSFLAILEKTKADLVLMDISLNGEKNGLELIRYLRKNNLDYKHTPIICYTAHAFSQDKINAMNAGADIFLAKPVSIEILIETIETALQKREKAN